MKNLTDFRKTLEVGVDLRLIVLSCFKPYRLTRCSITVETSQGNRLQCKMYIICSFHHKNMNRRQVAC